MKRSRPQGRRIAASGYANALPENVESFHFLEYALPLNACRERTEAPHEALRQRGFCSARTFQLPSLSSCHVDPLREFFTYLEYLHNFWLLEAAFNAANQCLPNGIIAPGLPLIPFRPVAHYDHLVRVVFTIESLSKDVARRSVAKDLISRTMAMASSFLLDFSCLVTSTFTDIAYPLPGDVAERVPGDF